LVENAIKHGTDPCSSGGRIEISSGSASENSETVEENDVVAY